MAKTWGCKIGEIGDATPLPPRADAPMREAVYRAYKELTGRDPDFIFSGWGAHLTEGERAAHEDRDPDPALTHPGADWWPIDSED